MLKKEPKSPCSPFIHLSLQNPSSTRFHKQIFSSFFSRRIWKMWRATNIQDIAETVFKFSWIFTFSSCKMVHTGLIRNEDYSRKCCLTDSLAGCEDLPAWSWRKGRGRQGGPPSPAPGTRAPAVHPPAAQSMKTVSRDYQRKYEKGKEKR